MDPAEDLPIDLIELREMLEEIHSVLRAFYALKIILPAILEHKDRAMLAMLELTLRDDRKLSERLLDDIERILEKLPPETPADAADELDNDEDELEEGTSEEDDEDLFRVVPFFRANVELRRFRASYLTRLLSPSLL